MLDAISKEAAVAFAKTLADELAVKYDPAAFPPALNSFADELVSKLKDALIGREITFTIVIK